MITNLMGSSSGALTVATDKFNGLSMFSSAWGTAITTQNVMPCAGTLQNFYVKMDTTNPSGKTFAIYKNGVDSGITITIPNGSTSGNDTTHTLAFAAGDTISVHATGGDAVTSVGVVRWTIGASCNANQSMILGGSGAAQGTVFPNYVAVCGDNGDATAGTNVEEIIPTAGTIKNAYVALNSTIAAASTLTYTLVKNGVDTTLIVTISASTSTGNDTNAGHAVTVAAGDKLYWRVNSTGTPGSKTSAVSVEFDPTTDGESVVMYGGSKAQATGTTNKFWTLGQGNATTSATEPAMEVLTQACVFRNMYVLEQTAIAAGSLKYTLDKNAGIQAGGPNVTITGGATTGNDTANTLSAAVGDTMSMVVTPTNPTVSLVEWGIVSYIAPVVASAGGFLPFF